MPSAYFWHRVRLPVRTTTERFFKWLDDCDDLLVVFRVQAPAFMITAMLAAAFLAGLGAFLLLGAPDLHAAP
ncbi:MAG TPA: hypothetical protein VF055_06115 [Steroidobacteraceae bacterium]